MKNIIIVESPSKSKTIESYLGKEYTVLSSKGHITNLASKGKGGLGVDIENGFKPTYEILPEKKKLVTELKKACKGANVFLATDPDREGEAISYHLAQVLNLDLTEANRILFHEITKPAILEAVNNPTKIDMNLVNSQEARRILDRIIGYKVSSLLRSKIKSQSAGRVQSVALRMICELEDEIRRFVKEKYYEAEAIFDDFKLKLVSINGNKERILDRSILEKLLPELKEFILDDIISKESKRESKPPYTTSTLQQDASNKLGYSSSRTMSIAQVLYEGVELDNMHTGLITYMRTDSTHLSDVFVKSAREYILNNFGQEYLGTTKEKAQKLAQNAHEAIRVTDVNRTPSSIKKYLSKDEYNLYSLIYFRTIASLMAPAKFINTKYVFSNTNSIWETKGQSLLFDGYLKAAGLDEEDLNKLLPNLEKGSKHIAKEVNILDLETKPKSRYTEATLIKDMEEKGIGRPSTYALVLPTLLKREYVSLDGKKIMPTEQGELTNSKLTEFFDDVFNVSYTAKMEEHLDKISNGTETELAELTRFYETFNPLYLSAVENMEKIAPEKTGELCPVCGSDLVIRKGKYGNFVACSNYPTCKYIKQDEENKPIDTGITCHKCGGKILQRVAKTGKNKGNIFYACENYPKCNVIFNDKPTTELCDKCQSIMLENAEGVKYCSSHCEELENAIVCPNCKTGHIVKKVATRGKNKGNTFYACDNYPKCKTIYSDMPTNELCPKCNSVMLQNEKGELYCSKHCEENEVTEEIICPNCKTGHLVKKVATRGKNKGNTFYACDNYPKCKTIFNDKPLNQFCDKCGSVMLEDDKQQVYCSNEECDNHKRD